MKELSSDLEVFRQTRSTVDLVCVKTSKSLLNFFIFSGAKIASNQAPAGLVGFFVPVVHNPLGPAVGVICLLAG